MNTNKQLRTSLRMALMGTVALSVGIATPFLSGNGSYLMSEAHAQMQGGGGGNMGANGSGHAPGTSGQSMGHGGSSGTHGHYGQGGSTGTETGDEGTSTDKQVPRYGGSESNQKPAAGTTGGRPAWAKEGIPEVELGRLSVARSPEHVLDHAFSEAVSNWSTMGTTVMVLSAEGQETLTMTVAQLYSLSATEFSYIVKTYYSSIVRIDSPLENLSLLKSYVLTDASPLSGVSPAGQDDMVAIYLGSASDKTIPITADTVTAINTILGLPSLTPEQTADIAVKAEDVRLAILSGHG